MDRGCFASNKFIPGLILSPAHMDLCNLPPMLIHAGDREILLSDARCLAEGARKAGGDVIFKVWEGLWHVFHSSASVVPEARRAISELGIFVQEHLN